MQSIAPGQMGTGTEGMVQLHVVLYVIVRLVGIKASISVGVFVGAGRVVAPVSQQFLIGMPSHVIPVCCSPYK